MDELRQKIEDTLCQCDPDSLIDDFMLDMMIDRLLEVFTEELKGKESKA